VHPDSMRPGFVVALLHSCEGRVAAFDAVHGQVGDDERDVSVTRSFVGRRRTTALVRVLPGPAPLGHRAEDYGHQCNRLRTLTTPSRFSWSTGLQTLPHKRFGGHTLMSLRVHVVRVDS
jgi:hypothetical protein